MSGAPYSDNLYSGDSSDDEALLSPANGYFHASSPTHSSPEDPTSSPAAANVPTVPNVLVEDPTLRQPDKAREAREEAARESVHEGEALNQSRDHLQAPSGIRLDSVASPSLHRHTSVDGDDQSDVRRSNYPYGSGAVTPTPLSVTERGPFFQHLQHHIDAPPAYSPPARTTADIESGYRTFPTPTTAASEAMGSRDEYQGLLARDPESMGGPIDDAPQTRWHRLRGWCRVRNPRAEVRSLLGVLLIISISAAVVGWLASSPTSRHHNPSIPKIPSGQPPQTPGSDGDHGRTGHLKWDSRRACRNSAHYFSTVVLRLETGPDKDWKIEQDHQAYEYIRLGQDVDISGQVIVMPTDDTEGAVVLEVISNDENLKINFDMDSAKQEFVVETPRNIAWAAGELGPCIQMRITVLIPKKAVFRSTKITAFHLDVDITEGVSFAASEGTHIEAAAGHIDLPAAHDETKGVLSHGIDSRRIFVSTVSGSIKGAFPLYDLLKVSTVSGSVDIFISPKEILKEKPLAAILDVRSSSGSILIREPITGIADPDSLPARYYSTKVETSDGSIEAALAMNSVASFLSRSGSIEVKLLPVYNKASDGPQKSKLETDAHSGHTSVELLEPVWMKLEPIGNDGYGAGDGWDGIGFYNEPNKESVALAAGVTTSHALSFLDSYHHTLSGAIRVQYPNSWTGTIHESSLSGQLSARGKNVEITRRGGTAWKVLEGHAGSGSSDVKIKTVSGSIDLLVGDDF